MHECPSSRLGCRAGHLRTAALLVCALAGLLAAAPAAGAVTRDGARSKALKVTKAERSHSGVILFGLRSPIRARASIRESGRHPGAAGSVLRTMRSVRVADGRSILRLTREPAYFFYLDRGAYQANGHRGRVVLVGAHTGRVLRSRSMQFAPAINGKLPIFLRSRSDYELSRYRVAVSPYSVAGTVARAARADGFGPFARSFAPRSAASEGLVGSRLSAEKSCTVVVGNRRAGSAASLGSTRANPVMPLLNYDPSKGVSLRSYVATEAIARQGCRNVLFALAGDGYSAQSPPSVRTHLSTSGSRMREYHVTSGVLRTIIAANPSVAFKLMIDAPGSGAFIESLQSLSNLLVIATSSTATQTAFRYVPNKRIGGTSIANPLHMRSDSSFFTTLLLGGAAFANSDAEVGHAAGEVEAGRAPSFLAYMIARAFALSRPFDFSADLGATQRLYVRGFTPTPPGAGGPANAAPVAMRRSSSVSTRPRARRSLRRSRGATSRRRRSSRCSSPPRARTTRSTTPVCPRT